MKKLMLIFFLFSSGLTYGTKYWVKNGGSDANNGTSEALAKASIQAAVNIAGLTGGDTIWVLAGTYSETTQYAGSEYAMVQIPSTGKDGSSGSPIVLKSATKWGADLDGNGCYHGIMMNADYWSVEGFEIYDVRAWPFTIWGTSTNINVIDCYIHDIGNVCDATDTNGFSGILIDGATNVLVDRCAIKNIGRYAPQENGCQNAGTHYRYHDHGIYAGAFTNLIIQNSIFMDCDNGWSIHIYDGDLLTAYNLKIYNNTFYSTLQRSPGNIILAHILNGFEIKNNLFIMAEGANCVDFDSTLNVAIHIDEDAVGNMYDGVVSYNRMFSGNDVMTDQTLAEMSVANNTTDSDPLVTDYEGYNYTLTSNSPCINAGDTDQNLIISYDFAGTSRSQIEDVGAYEYHSSTPPAPSGYHVTYNGHVVTYNGQVIKTD